MAEARLLKREHRGTPQVVVVGAGFGGLAVTRALARAKVEVLLVDRHNHHLFQPLLYQVATAALSPANIASPIRSLLSSRRTVEVQLGEVDGIDPDQRTVSVKDVGRIEYDYLVLATGATASWFGHEDWAQHSLSLKSLWDADRLRERLLGAFERAESAMDAEAVQKLLTFVIVGGGASGVELAGAVQELARSTLRRDFRRIRTDQARVILLESGPALLEGLPEGLANYACARLQAMGVEVRLGDAVETLDAEGVVTAGERIRSANIFWCAGVAPTPMADWLGVKAGKKGAVRVGPDCSVPGRAEVFAIGDVAEFEGSEGKPLPGVAPVAQQQGKYVAKVIAARIAGRPAPPTFRYKDQGSLAIIGRASAVADLPFARLTGRPAWLLWSGVHLVLLNGLHNRVLVYVQWLWAWLSYGRGARLIEDLLPPELAPARQAPGAGLTQEKA